MSGGSSKQERERARADHERRVAERQREADQLTATYQRRVEELEAILRTGVARRLWVDFDSMRRSVATAPFRPGPDLAAPRVEPQWADYAPRRLGRLSRLWHGTEYELRNQQAAWLRFEQDLAAHRRQEDHRKTELEDARLRHTREQDRRREAAEAHNSRIDDQRRRFAAGDQEAVERCLSTTLSQRALPSGVPSAVEIGFRLPTKQILVLRKLPDTNVVPTELSSRYIKSRDAIEGTIRKTAEVRQRYADLIAQLALLTLHDVFTATSPEQVMEVTVNGQLDTTDRATGQQVQRCLVTVSATREEFQGLVLDKLKPQECLRHLNALISPNPYDVEPVRPLFEPDLSRFRLIDAHEVAAGLDARTVLAQLTPTEFEHLIRELFEHMGMQSWVTQASRDDGVDAVAVNPDPVMGGLCVIQAKRYIDVVPADAVRALWGSMEDKKAGTGVLVTSSYFGKTTHEFAHRNERVRLIEGPQLKHLIREYLGKDVLPGAKPPPRTQRWRDHA